MTNKIKIVLISLLLLILIGGGLLTVTATSKETKTEIYVLAASSLTESMTEIVDQYNSEQAHTRIILNLASSGSLQRQIEQGAPCDIFISASVVKMDNLVESGHVSRADIVELFTNELVLIANESSNRISGFDDLLGHDTLIFAMGEPGSVPAGAYAKETLECLGLYDEIIKYTVLAKNVKEVVTWVELGEVDAGLVYKTDALISESVKILAYADGKSHQPIVYPGAVLHTSKDQLEALKFFEYLQSDTAMTVIEDNGFIPCN